MHWSISLKFSTEFQHVTASTWFKVKGLKVKVTVHNSQHRFTSNMSRFVTYLPRECVEHPPTTRMRIAHSGRIGSTWRLPGALRKMSENNIFKPNKPEKPRTSGAKSEWPSRCNAFAIAHFLVYFCFGYMPQINLATCWFLTPWCALLYCVAWCFDCRCIILFYCWLRSWVSVS